MIAAAPSCVSKGPHGVADNGDTEPVVVELVEKHENWRPALDPLPDGQLVHHQLMSGGQIELISGMRRSSAPAALNASSQQLQDVE